MLKSLIKKNGHYAILRITTKGHEFSATDDNTFMIPIRLMKQCQHETKNSMLPSTAASSSNYKKVRIGKGTPPLMIVWQMMSEKENWIAVTNKISVSWCIHV